MSKSELEESVAFYIKTLKLPPPEREHRFHPTRRWRFDFAWPEKKLAIECEGGIWTGGAHARGAHFNSDTEKYNEATLLGWRVLRFTSNQIKNGKVVEWLTRVFA